MMIHRCSRSLHQEDCPLHGLHHHYNVSALLVFVPYNYSSVDLFNSILLLIQYGNNNLLSVINLHILFDYLSYSEFPLAVYLLFGSPTQNHYFSMPCAQINYIYIIIP